MFYPRSQTAAPTSRLFIDMIAGVMTLTVDGVATSGKLGGFVGFRLDDGIGAEFHGSDVAESFWGPSRPGLVAYMGGGDDIVRGTKEDDSIDGGDGNDAAYGNGGTDVCTAVEEEDSC